jgi:multicomponent Na+:H+ antiporter subunit G
MTWLDLTSGSLIGFGLLFFVAGTAGLLRFPDVFARLHALTKADNLGLGLVATGVGLHSGSWLTVVKLVLIWMLVMSASATVCFLVARRALRDGVEPWRREHE